MQLCNKTIAITGAGGFIGLSMVNRCQQLGMTVRGLDCSATAADRASAAGAEMIIADVGDVPALNKLCDGTDIVFHTAAIVREGGSWDLFRKVNVEGTRNVCSAAATAGVQQFVHVSSVMVYGFDYPPNVPEDGPLNGENNPYCQTKIESEQVAFEFSDQMQVIALRCGDVYGPGSVPWTIRPVEMMNRFLFALPSFGKGVLNHVYIDNLIDAVCLAMESNASGEAFNITDGEATVCRDFFGHYLKMTRMPFILNLPTRSVRDSVWLFDKICRLFGRRFYVGPEFIPFLNRRNAYSIEKARTTLGYEPKIDLDSGMRLTHEWLAAQNLVKHNPRLAPIPDFSNSKESYSTQVQTLPNSSASIQGGTIAPPIRKSKSRQPASSNAQ